MRTLCSSTLIGEALLAMFAGLVAMRLSSVSTATVWIVTGIAMALCIALCGMINRPGAVQIGWALQIGLIASGLILPTMFGLGVVFAALWWCSVHYGRKVDEFKAARAAAVAAAAEA
ncbi:DUF4233 domain-containing protein [Streptomyces sp. SP17BM10]|uniref:DUF4233 domain-containing protein n=1 Tax=Streptomyces sp. SP17BM10 TaxID=3002530 RepID=UPI002E78B003|nr:DUF4233 domain-containing protein [Streptomyces sp. SP17BM10]MEE1787983.1 DUF4233 domain-containing protein [Streptomyces sp. SP17BM10]